MFISSLIYLVLPFIIFCVGFLKWYIAIIAIAATIYSCYRVYIKTELKISWNLLMPKYGHLIILVFSALICWQCGIGSFWSQTDDFNVKNPLLNDLCHKSWPLYYDLSQQSAYTQSIIGGDKVTFVYYLFYYLPAACVGKGFGLLAARITLLIWSILGLYLVLLWVIRFLEIRKITTAKIIGILFIFFSFAGLDVIADIIKHFIEGNIPGNWLTDLFCHQTEIWCSVYKGSSFFTTYSGTAWNLDWVFNQCIPCWLIVMLLITPNNFKYSIFIFSFILLYSPWATLGLCPIVIYVWIRKFIDNRDLFKQSLSFENVCYPLIILLIVGSYYLSKNGAIGVFGPWWNFVDSKFFFKNYIFFIFIEVGFYFLLLWRDNKHDYFFQAAVIVLLLIPFYKITPCNDLLMRGSLPGIFILFLFWAKFIFTYYKKNQILIKSILAITCLCSIQSFSNDIGHYLKTGDIRIRNRMTSFEKIPISDESDNYQYQELCDSQFFNHKYADSFFFKYFAE